MRVRKNYRSLTGEERDRLVAGLYHAKENGTVDRFADMHAEHFSHGIHRSSHFLPWHREQLLRFEMALREFDPEIVIPYWDSTLDQSPSDPLWKDDFLGQFDAAWNLERVLGLDTLPSAQLVEENRRRDSYGSFWPDLERDIHNPPHRWVGGDMATVHSPRDPIFYFHHCWIDLLWVLWQCAHPDAPFEASGPGLGLDDSLMEWPNRTPRDVLDHRALGYHYDTEGAGLIA
jgi:tyrosinase